MDGDNILDAEKAFELLTLRNEIEKLKNEVIKYKILLNEIDSEANPDIISDEEAICVEQIHKLKENSGKRQLSTDEVKKLDILHKNLKLARGQGQFDTSQTLKAEALFDALAAGTFIYIATIDNMPKAFCCRKDRWMNFGTLCLGFGWMAMLLFAE